MDEIIVISGGRAIERGFARKALAANASIASSGTTRAFRRMRRRRPDGDDDEDA